MSTAALVTSEDPLNDPEITASEMPANDVIENRVVKATGPVAQKVMNVLGVIGLGFINPFIRLAYGEDPKAQLKELWLVLIVPVLAIIIFLFAWHSGAKNVQTSLGQIPGPVQVWEQSGELMKEHRDTRAKADAFYQRQDDRNAQFIANGQVDKVKQRKFTGKETFIDQIFTSLRTVFFGFLIATIVAVPIGIFCGLSPLFNSAMNPLIQIFKPVSPLAWLPIVTMVVSALYINPLPGMSKSFLVSAIVVTLCSLWATLLNTAHGVASIDKDLLNVAKVLKLKTWEKITKIVLPSSLPLIFTGLRLSLGVGWMVLIAAEMLAQNPGLGKFVWDEFQNGSSNSLARIMVAGLTIGVIGFLLDRLMYTLQAMFTFSDKR
jgi:nitrate/nitrite transport system permease protein